MKAVIDTNVLIDYLNGHDAAAEEIARYREPIISRISWLEVLAGARPGQEEHAIRTFLRIFSLRELDDAVAEEAVDVRRRLRLRMPDAIILATARVIGCLLVTRNTRDFDPEWPEVREPYRL